MPSFNLLRQRASASSVHSVTLEDGTQERPRTIGSDVARFFKDFQSAPDRGKTFYQHERQRQHLVSLIEAGRHAGRSRVDYEGRNIKYHLFTKDFFITMINQKTTSILLITAAVYLVVFLFFSIWWWLIVRYYPGCMYGATSYVEAFTFAVVTHMTIGYGNTGPQACWLAAWLIAFQIIIALLLESIVIGIVFARISHPKQRSRSIFISDSSIIARRDGILKFMFRVADIRRTQVVDPKIKAFMYTWGEGRVTAEGERIPVRCEPLDIGYIDGMLLLPLIIEHTIDERSPLCGHTHDSLLALNAEVVVTFEGTTEFGNPFMSRRSYLPTEMHWGHQFADIVVKPDNEDTKYIIDLNKFHDVLPQDGLPLLAPSQLSQLVVNRAKRTVPYPLLGENTLVLSDVLCVAPNEQGQPCLMCRAADTYPNQMLEITARMYLYRWRQTGETQGPVYTQHALSCGYRTGEDRLYLRLPVEVCHVITEDSPIARWLQPGGIQEDADSEIVVLINCYLHVNGQNRLRQRTYTVHHHVRYGYRFQNIVKHPAESRDRKPRVRWAHFHDVQAVEEEESGALPPRDDVGLPSSPSHPALQALHAQLPSIAPESHGALRSVEQRQHMWSQSAQAEVATARAAATASSGGERGPTRGSSVQQPAAAAGAAVQLGRPTSQQQRLPLPAAAATAAGPAVRQSYVPTAEEQRNDYTVLPIDLSRYAVTAGNEGDSYPLGPMDRRSPLPTEFAQALAAAAKHKDEVEDGSGQPFLLFPEVANYALNTTEAADSLPHPQALHPTLPGPDRFRFDVNEERNDYTVLPMDLSRYMAQVGRSDTMPRRTGRGPIMLGEAAALLAQQEWRQQQQEQQQQQRAGSSRGQSGYGTPVSGFSGASPSIGLARQSSGGSTPPLPPAASPGAAAAAAAALAAVVGRNEQERQQQQEQQEVGGRDSDESSSPGSPAAAAAAAAGPAAGGQLVMGAAAALAEQQRWQEQQQQQQQQGGLHAVDEDTEEEEQQQLEELQQQEQQREEREEQQRREERQQRQEDAEERQRQLEEQQQQEEEEERREQQEQQREEQQRAAGREQQQQQQAAGGRKSEDEEQRKVRKQLEQQQQVGGRRSEDEEQRKVRKELEQQLHRRLRRATSTRNLVEHGEDEEEQEEGSGPIHFSKEESWQRERALKNLFAAPDSPKAADQPGTSGGGANGGGTDR